MIIPYDLDKDGVNEIVISTGGNPTIPSDVHVREPGLVMLYSGRTGLIIGKELILPESKETYMSPVLLTQQDGSSYLLIGSGGETILGNLYIISLPDFFNAIVQNVSKIYTFKGNYRSSEILLKNFKQNEKIKGLFSLYKCSSKGIMVPPVLVDVNQDDTNDILMLSFDGEVVLFNGLTFERIWERKFACHETYTSPSPGYFDDDDILDFMLVQNLGTFDFYINSSILILSGLDGSTLWQMNTARMQMVSPLTIQTSSDRDVFFFEPKELKRVTK